MLLYIYIHICMLVPADHHLVAVVRSNIGAKQQSSALLLLLGRLLPLSAISVHHGCTSTVF